MDKEKVIVELDDKSLEKLKFAISDGVADGISHAIFKLTSFVTLISLGIVVAVVIFILYLLNAALKAVGIHLFG